jgi:hypothetical protein
MARRQAAADRGRLSKLKKALSSGDPLPQVRELIAERNKEQQVVVWAYACILEVNSAGLTIAFDRFTPPELAKIGAALREIGATQTLADLALLRRAFDDATEHGMSRMEASEAVTESALGRERGRAHEAHVQEMEGRLLAYCREKVEQLAAVEQAVSGLLPSSEDR